MDSGEGPVGPVVDPAASFRESDGWSEPMEAVGSEAARKKPAVLVWIALGGGALFLLLLVFCFAAIFVVPNVLQKYAVASRGKARADLIQIENALKEYSLANGGKYPDTLEALVTPDMNGYTYIKGTKIPRDPWGNDYLYDPPSSEGGLPIVYTFGKDGQRGGEGDDADIDSLSLRVAR